MAYAPKSYFPNLHERPIRNNSLIALRFGFAQGTEPVLVRDPFKGYARIFFRALPTTNDPFFVYAFSYIDYHFHVCPLPRL